MDYETLMNSALNIYYPDESMRQQARSTLQQYEDREALRVRLAILKLAEHDLDKLAHYVDRANQDYRDILGWAEYPNTASAWDIKKSDPEGYQKLQAKDKQQHEDWLDSLR